MPLIFVNKFITQATLPGEFATLNPNDSTRILSNANLTSSGTSAQTARATVGKSQGKWYWETIIDQNNVSNSCPIYGISVKEMPLRQGWTYPYSCVLFVPWGTAYVTRENNITSPYGLRLLEPGTVTGFALDMDNLTFEIYQNGQGQGKLTIAPGTYYPTILDGGSGRAVVVTANFGQKPFVNPVPAGFNPGVY